LIATLVIYPPAGLWLSCCGLNAEIQAKFIPLDRICVTPHFYL
jgi:hypothetical protein